MLPFWDELTFWEQLTFQLGATPAQLLGVVIAVVGMYLVFLLCVRVFGSRALQGMSTFDSVLAITFGAVAGRAILGNAPTLAGGVVALVMLFVMEAIFGQIRTTVRGTRLLNSRPVVVMIGHTPDQKMLHRTHVTEPELNFALRRAGVRSRHEVACVIFEPNGHLSVLRRGEPLDPQLLDNVVGADRLPPELLGPAQ